MYVLDTDHIGIIQRATDPRYRVLSRRMAQHSQRDFYVAIVSFHEQIVGWNSYIARAKDGTGIVRGYSRLAQILADFSRAQVLSLDDPAWSKFESLRQQKIRVATMDLRIAAIALMNDMTVLTCNTVDFQRVPGLRVEDWTI